MAHVTIFCSHCSLFLITKEIDAVHKPFTLQSSVSTFAFPESEKINVLDLQLHQQGLTCPEM
jgi:hypothetical protein